MGDVIHLNAPELPVEPSNAYAHKFTVEWDDEVGCWRAEVWCPESDPHHFETSDLWALFHRLYHMAAPDRCDRR